MYDDLKASLSENEKVRDSAILNMPSELLLQILEYLQIPDLMKLAQVSKKCAVMAYVELL